MIIKEIYIENFGRLHHEKMTFSDGLNIIARENGAGKTTLTAFLLSMFYGMPSVGNKKNLSQIHRKKYRPWQGGEFGGYMIFEENGKLYRVIRYFADREKDDKFLLIDEKTGLESNDYSSRLGVEIFGVDKDTYLNSAFAGFEELGVNVGNALSARLADVSSESGFDGIDKKFQILDEEYKEYVKLGNRGKLSDIDRDITANEVAAWNIQKEIQLREQKISVNTENINKLKSDNGKSREDEEISAIEKKIRKQENEYNKLSEKLEKSIKKKTGIVIALSLVSMIVFAGIAAIVFTKYFGDNTYSAAAAWGTVYIIFLLAVIISVRVKRQNKRESLEISLRICEDEKTKLSGELEKAVDRQVQKKVSEQKYITDIEYIRIEIENLEEEYREISEKIENLYKEKSSFNERAEILKLTKDYMQQAVREYIRDYISLTEASFKKYMCCFDEELAEKVRVDLEYKISVYEGADIKDMDYYSLGQKSIMWLCERLAFIEKIYNCSSPVIVFDDILLPLDSKMRKKAMELLKTVSDKHQIIYCCTESLFA